MSIINDPLSDMKQGVALLVEDKQAKSTVFVSSIIYNVSLNL